MRTVGDDEADALQQAYLQGVLEGERSAGAHVGIAPTARRRLFRPRTRRRWFPPLITGIASIGLTLALVNFLHIQDDKGAPIDNHPSVSVVNGFGQPLPAPLAPAAKDSAHTTQKSPAATSEDVTTGQGGEASGMQEARESTSSGTKASAAGDSASANRSTSGSKSSGTTSGSTSGSSKGSGSRPASTRPASKPPASSGDGSVPAAPPADSDPTPAPTQDAGPVRTLVGGLGTTVGDLGDVVSGTLNGVGGLLGGDSGIG